VRGAVRRSIPYIIAIAGGFALAYLIVAFLVFPAGVIPQDLKVPNVVGLLYPDASMRLQQAGFVAAQGEARYNATAPRTTVLDQTPPPGSKDVAGATVTLAVSNGQQLISVPNLVGMTQEQATAAVESAGFSVGDVTAQASDQPRGAVVQTSPGAGVQVPVPSAVALVVSSGPELVQVPDVVGRNFVEAQQLLEQVGLAAGTVTTDTLAAPQGAMVLSMSPAAGAQVPRGTRINLRVTGGVP
jgi:serine/threonine-protein kinase